MKGKKIPPKPYLIWGILLAILPGFALTAWAKTGFERYVLKHPYVPVLSFLVLIGVISLLVLTVSSISRKLQGKPSTESSELARKEIKDRLLHTPAEQLAIDRENFPRAVLYYTNRVTGKEDEYRLVPGRDFLMGRLSHCQAHLEDPKISREHALIRAEKRGYVLYDLASRRGVYVNGKKVSKHLLRDGQVISLENHQLEFRLGEKGEET